MTEAKSIQFLELDKLSEDDLAKILRRAEQDISELLPLAQSVSDDVKTNGDAAVVKYARKFDAENFEASMLKAKARRF